MKNKFKHETKPVTENQEMLQQKLVANLQKLALIDLEIEHKKELLAKKNDELGALAAEWTIRN